MRKLIVVLLLLLCLPALWMLISFADLLPITSDAQRAALERIRREPDWPGRNAYAAVNAIRFALPPGELERLEADPTQASTERLAERFDELPTPDGNEFAGCRAWAPNCLEAVRQRRADAAAYLDRYAEFLQRRPLLQQYGHVADAFPTQWDAAPPTLGGLGTPIRIQAALRVLDGDAVGALDHLCHDADLWRRLANNTDLVVVATYAQAQIASHARLYARIRAESGDSPGLCAALQPLAAGEFDQCALLHGEFTRNAPVLRGEHDGIRGLGERLLLKPEHTQASWALALQPYCAADDVEEARRRPPATASCGTIDWLFNPLGCSLGEIAVPAYHDYRQRLLDLDSRLRLLGAAVALEDVDSAERVRQFADRPDALQDERHELRVDDRCQPRLALRERITTSRGGSGWEIPLRAPTDCR